MLTTHFRNKNHLDQNKQDNLLALEYLYRFNVIFNELNNLNKNYSYINTISHSFWYL